MEMYPKLFHADYYAEDCKGRIMLDLSFTFLNWAIIEQLRDSKITLNDIDQNYIK